VLGVFGFGVTLKDKIDFVENWLCVKIPIFPLIYLLFSPTRLKTLGNFPLLTPQSTN
jgi:hypothetical protein